MSKERGKIFEVFEGNYKGKFFATSNAEQIEHYLRQNRLVGTLYEDMLLKKHVPHPQTGKKMLHIIEIKKLKLVGFID